MVCGTLRAGPFPSQFARRCEVVVCVDLRTRLPRAVLDFFMKRL